jgi:RNA recognition motif-containing protein
MYALNLLPVNLMTPIERLDLIPKTDILNNIFKNVPDNFDLLFSTFKNYESKKIKINRDELYLGNLDRDLKYEDIFEFLSQFGKLDNLIMNYMKNKNDGRRDKKSKNLFSGFCFVKFKDEQIHDKLIKNSNLYSLRNRKVIFSEKLEKIQTLEDIEKSCWFCFNNPNIEKDLIVIDFRHFYLAYPKGPIDNFHLLIIPKFHIKNYLDIPEELNIELDYIIKVLRKFYSDNKMDYVIYEKYLPYKDEKAKHMLLNFVGINKDFSFEIFDKINDYLSKEKIKYEIFNSNEWNLSDTKINEEEIFYHYIEIPSGIKLGNEEKRMKILIPHLLNLNTKFDFTDYSRLLICEMIGKKQNINWKVDIIFILKMIKLISVQKLMSIF